ncbi:MAG: AtpZ/AtpI family protein [Ruminococcaceae bacterium]|nr:AtpZ/AtpI family protein [Oscillospiraceae bacterium]
MMLFQVYSNAIASLAVPPLLFGLLGNYLCGMFGWHRGWMAVLIFAGLIIGAYSAVHMLKKSVKLTSARSRLEREGLYRIHRDSNASNDQSIGGEQK